MISEIVIAFDEDDQPWAEELAERMKQAGSEISASLRFSESQLPPCRLCPYRAIPSEESLDATSMLVAVLPKKGTVFSPDVQQKLTGYLKPDRRGEGLRVLPVALENDRVWSPAPLTPLVAFHLFDLNDTAAVTALTTRVLILMSLLTVGDMGVFISYRQKDGLPLAKALFQRLQSRGYKAWRDDEPDRDRDTLMGSGNDAQKRISEEIERHGFVLLIDTPEAPHSAWVQEEVSLANGRLFPVLPIVVTDDPDEHSSRFRQLAGFTTFKLGVAALDAAQVDALLDAAMADLEHEIARVALRHAQTRRRLVYDSRIAFSAMQYRWSQHHDGVHFIGERDLDDDRSPGLKLRLLVLCSPYRRLSEDQLELLEKCFDDRLPAERSRFQFGVLMHNSSVPSAYLPKLIRGASHLLITEPSKVSDLFAKHRL